MITKDQAAEIALIENEITERERLNKEARQKMIAIVVAACPFKVGDIVRSKAKQPVFSDLRKSWPYKIRSIGRMSKNLAQLQVSPMRDDGTFNEDKTYGENYKGSKRSSEDNFDPLTQEEIAELTGKKSARDRKKIAQLVGAGMSQDHAELAVRALGKSA